MAGKSEVKIGNGTFWNGDCLELMNHIPDGSVDMILCDLPYGTTACKWDTVIPFEPLWRQYWRVAKPNAAIVLTASQPFTTALIGSQIKRFKYCWVWEKTRASGFANAKKMPLRKTEDVCVFYKTPPSYNPQGITRIDKKMKNSSSVGGDTVRGVTSESEGKGSLRTSGKEYVQEFTNYPSNVLNIPNETGIHPTQKLVALFEYLIRTYTNPGETVMDNCAGSGTTAIAAERTGRKWICIEKDIEYFNDAIKRVTVETSQGVML